MGLFFWRKVWYNTINYAQKRENMDEYRSTEQLAHESHAAQQEEQSHYTTRPKSQIVLEWILAAVVLFAFLGTCYWLMFGKF